MSTVSLQGYNGHHVDCFVPQSERSNLTKLSKGQQVTFIGTESNTLLEKQVNRLIYKDLKKQGFKDRDNPGFRAGWAVQLTDCVPTAVFARIRIGRLRKPMDIGRKFKTDFSFERKPL